MSIAITIHAMFRFQGDIPFYPFKGNVSGEIMEHSGSFILALGETTGHKHVITVPKIDDMVVHKLSDGGWLLTLKSEGTVTHNTHGTLMIPKGTYRVGHEREVDHFMKAIRKVID